MRERVSDIGPPAFIETEGHVLLVMPLTISEYLAVNCFTALHLQLFKLSIVLLVQLHIS